jgi:SpoIIAA-like
MSISGEGPVIHFDSRWLTIHWDEARQAVWMEWRAYAEGQEYRAGLDAGLSLIRLKRASRWLADLRHLGPVAQPDQAWSNENWFPRALAAGIRSMALVAPETAVARLSVNRIMSRVHEEHLVTAYFSTVESARAWLRTQG